MPVWRLVGGRISGGGEHVHWSEECDKCCKALWGPSRLIRCRMNERPFADVLNAYATTNHPCLKMAPRHPSAVPPVRWRLTSSCYCNNARADLSLLTREGRYWARLGAPSCPRLSARGLPNVQLEREAANIADLKQPFFFVLNTFYCQTRGVFSGITPRCKGQNNWQFEKYKKKKKSLFLPPSIQVENVTSAIETAQILPDTFSTDNSFHGRLTSDLALTFSLFNSGWAA